MGTKGVEVRSVVFAGAGIVLVWVQLLTGEVAVGVVEANPFILLHADGVMRVAVSAMLEAFGSDVTEEELMLADSALVAKFIDSARNVVGESSNSKGGFKVRRRAA